MTRPFQLPPFRQQANLPAWAGRHLLRQVAGEPALQVGGFVEVQQIVSQPVEHGDRERPDALLVLFGQHAQPPRQEAQHRGRSAR